jgi:hypothetical protein
MKIQHNLGLTIPTKTIVLQNCIADLFKDNHNVYCIENLLRFLTKEFIGVDKQDILLIKTLKLHKITHVTI